MFKRQICLSLLCLIAGGMIVHCAGNETPFQLATVVPSLSTPVDSNQALPTLFLPNPATLPGFVVSDCHSTEQQLLPYVCGIVPGQTKMDEVREWLGEPTTIRTSGCCCVFFPGRWQADTCWYYLNVSVYFESEVVQGLGVGTRAYELTLREAIEVLGPPDQVIFFHTSDGAPQEWEQARRADGAYLLWPDKGVHIITALYGTQGIDLDPTVDVPPLPAELPLGVVTSFEPCTKGELEAFFREQYPPGEWVRWVEWPGMIE